MEHRIHRNKMEHIVFSILTTWNGRHRGSLRRLQEWRISLEGFWIMDDALFEGLVIPAKAGISYRTIVQLLIRVNGNWDGRFLIWATQDFIPCYKCREVKRTCICYTGASFVAFRNDVSFDGTLIVLEPNQRSNDQYLTTHYSILNTLY